MQAPIAPSALFESGMPVHTHTSQEARITGQQVTVAVAVAASNIQTRATSACNETLGRLDETHQHRLTLFRSLQKSGAKYFAREHVVGTFFVNDERLYSVPCRSLTLDKATRIVAM